METALEEKLKDLILSRYKTLADFSEECGINYQTLWAILSRGVNKASINNIIKICQTLGISTDELAQGAIVFVKKPAPEYIQIEKLRSSFEFMINDERITFEGEPLSEDEKYFLLDAIEINLELLKRKRIRDKFTEALND